MFGQRDCAYLKALVEELAEHLHVLEPGYGIINFFF